MLFVITIFNSSIIAEKDFSRLNMNRDLYRTRKKLEKLEDNVIQDCIETGNYSELLKFMGNGSKIITNAHINSSGTGLYLAKRIKYIKLMHPLPRFTRLGFFPPFLLNQWLFYIKFDNNTYKNKTALTYIEPENGDPPIYVNGSHSVLALLWQIIPINKYWTLQLKLDQWTDGNITLPLPWSIEKWRFKNYFNWALYPDNALLRMIPLVLIEFMIMFMVWPFNVWTSFLNFLWPSKIMGMAAFIIYNNSTGVT
jgi:hypothetical protein